jgi:hypothetical protein
MAIGFGLLWIPYVSDLGALLGLIGLILVCLGRTGFDELHHASVKTGTATILVAGGIGFLLTVGVTLSIVQAATTPGETLSQVGTSLASDLQLLFVGSAIVGILASLGEVVLVRGLADSTTWRILWAGFAANLVLSVLILWFVLPQVTSAVSSATSGATVNTGPISQIQTTALLWGLTKIIPSLLFAWAYLRAHDVARSRVGDPE